MPSELNPQTHLSPDHQIERIAFQSEVTGGYLLACELPFPVRMKAVLIPAEATVEANAYSMQLLILPTGDQDERERSVAARSWVESGNSGEPNRCLPIVVQGAQVFWSELRTAIIAPTERMQAVRRAVIEFCYFENELHDVERQIGDRWSLLDADTPLAFEFQESDVSKRKELMQRFRAVVNLRSKLARMTPHIECPPVYPPTLASQVAERLREKSRLPNRLEFMREQIEVFEKVYEMCSQRASDFVANRTSHTLEWVIVVLLAVEVILLSVDLLSATGT